MKKVREFVDGSVKFDARFSDALVDLIRRLLVREPSKRIGFNSFDGTLKMKSIFFRDLFSSSFHYRDQGPSVLCWSGVESPAGESSAGLLRAIEVS